MKQKIINYLKLALVMFIISIVGCIPVAALSLSAGISFHMYMKCALQCILVIQILTPISICLADTFIWLSDN